MTSALGANGHGRPQGGHACARACRCDRAKQSYLVIEIFVGASLLPNQTAWVKPCGLIIGLDPGPTMARPPPYLSALKILASLTEPPIFQIALQQKTPQPSSQTKGPISLVDYLTRDYKDLPHTAVEKPLTHSTATALYCEQGH